MAACEHAVARLNVIISQTCDEAEALRQLEQPEFEVAELVKDTSKAIDHSREVLAHLLQARVRQAHEPGV